MTNWNHGYRNRPNWRARKQLPPLAHEKPAIVIVGNLTVVFIRDAIVVTMKWRYMGKTYRKRLAPHSVNWRRAVAEARKEIMRRNARRRPIPDSDPPA